MIGRLSGRRAFQAFGDPAIPTERARSDALWCLLIRTAGTGPLRVAYAIGRRCGPAVQRNRLRRRLRAIIGEAATRHGLSSGAMLIGASPQATTATFGNLRVQVDKLFGQLASSKP